MTPDQQNLVALAQESLEAARLLLQEGYGGFAASRAYYAMFYMAEALLLGDGLSFSKHTAVHSAFGRKYAKTGRVPEHLHRYLIDAMTVRHTDDYGPARGRGGSCLTNRPGRRVS